MGRLSAEFVAEFTELMGKEMQLSANEFYQTGHDHPQAAQVVRVCQEAVAKVL